LCCMQLKNFLRTPFLQFPQSSNNYTETRYEGHLLSMGMHLS
jgi:hypothetical protein